MANFRLRSGPILVALFMVLNSPGMSRAGSTVLSGEGSIDVGLFTTFEEFGYGGSGGDRFVIQNTSVAEANITRIVIDTSTSSGNSYFDPAGTGSMPFEMSASVIADTGFLGYSFLDENLQQLVLEFSDFNVGEEFVFEVDVDDTFGWFVTGNDFSGTLLKATFGTTDSTAELFGAFASATGSWSLAEIELQGQLTPSNNPEPSSIVLFCIGSLVLCTVYRRNIGRRLTVMRDRLWPVPSPSKP